MTRRRLTNLVWFLALYAHAVVGAYVVAAYIIYLLSNV